MNCGACSYFSAAGPRTRRGTCTWVEFHAERLPLAVKLAEHFVTAQMILAEDENCPTFERATVEQPALALAEQR